MSQATDRERAPDGGAMAPAARRAFFEEHGWLVIRAAVDPDTLAQQQRAFESVMAPHRVVGAPTDAGGKALWQLPNGCRADKVLLTHLWQGLAQTVGDLLGAQRVQLLQDTLIVKPAGLGASIDLHQDYSYTGFLDPPRTVSVRLSLTDSSQAGGCLYVIDGSHHWGLQGRYATLTERLQEGILEALPAELRDQVEARRVALPLAAGDVSIHHCLTLHGSYENGGEQERRTVVAHVFDADCRVIWDRLPPGAEAYFATDALGGLPQDQFPILFQRTSGHDT